MKFQLSQKIASNYLEKERLLRLWELGDLSQDLVEQTSSSILRNGDLALLEKIIQLYLKKITQLYGRFPPVRDLIYKCKRLIMIYILNSKEALKALGRLAQLLEKYDFIQNISSGTRLLKSTVKAISPLSFENYLSFRFQSGEWPIMAIANFHGRIFYTPVFNFFDEREIFKALINSTEEALSSVDIRFP